LIAISPIASSQIPIEIDQEWGPPKSIATEFEQVWMSHDSHLDKLPGFVAFHLLKGPEAEQGTVDRPVDDWLLQKVKHGNAAYGYLCDFGARPCYPARRAYLVGGG
jgi:hypothetical protein